MPERPIAVTPGSVYAAEWAKLIRAVPDARPEQALGVGPGDAVLVVGAHPDDESLGAGATIASLVRAGVRVHAVSMSAGEAALDHLGRAPQGLAAQRCREYADACAALGIVESTIAGMPDGRLADHGPRLRSVVLEASERIGAACLLTVWWGDPHPDHAAVGRATVDAGASTATAVSGYPIWAQHWCDPADALRGVRLRPMRVSSDAEQTRRRAVGCYQSQIEPLAVDLLPVLPAPVVGWRPEVVLAS